MKENTKIIEFISYCIEMYADKKNMSGQEVAKSFDKYGVMEYLSENYDVLHTQGFGYILPLVDEYIAKQRGIL